MMLKIKEFLFKIRIYRRCPACGSKDLIEHGYPKGFLCEQQISCKDCDWGEYKDVYKK